MTKNGNKLNQLCSILILLISITVYGASSHKGKTILIDGSLISIEFNHTLQSRVISKLNNKNTVLGKYSNSESININGKNITDFKLSNFKVNDWQDSIGKGKEYELTGLSKNLKKKIIVVSYENYPAILFYNISYQNITGKTINVESWTNNHYSISTDAENKDSLSFWSYQPGSYGWENNWILPLKEGFYRENYLGMNHAEYGGGTPVSDVWRPDCGIAVGHIEKVPKLVSMPVGMPDKNDAELSVVYKKLIVLKPGDTLNTFRTFVSVHNGDCYNSLCLYREIMERQGFEFKKTPIADLGTEWCAWAFERNFTLDQISTALPKVKELGMKWVVLDMGWYKTIGDYSPNFKFPKGDEDIKKFVDKVHSYGLKIQLWWMPLAVEPNSELMAEHSGYLSQNTDGSPQYMPLFFKTFYLCAADPQVQEYSRQLVIKFMKWGFDGLKIDGNNQNCVPLCFNPDHHHSRPEESVEAIPAFYKTIFDAALSVNPEAKIEICPCGTNQSFFLMPYMNETVASDPHTSWQIRLKGKVLRALNPYALFYGDHVELSDDKCDFASTVGVGGTIGSKFVYPPGAYLNSENGDISLTPEKEKIWKKWIDIYSNNMLSKGKYCGNLYDIGFDRPETHAIMKEDTVYYAFYASKFKGDIELRGLQNKKYKIVDYENNIELGAAKGPVSKINVSFEKHLLIKVEPKQD
jgi:alpha-galactosidase